MGPLYSMTDSCLQKPALRPQADPSQQRPNLATITMQGATPVGVGALARARSRHFSTLFSVKPFIGLSNLESMVHAASPESRL